MVNYACAFNQSKSGKYFEWMMKTHIITWAPWSSVYILVIVFLLLFHFLESSDLNCKQYNILVLYIPVIDFLLLFYFLESTDLNCKQYNTCTDCIVGSPECTWCEDTVSLDFLLSFLYGQKVDKYKKSMNLNVSIFQAR